MRILKGHRGPIRAVAYAPDDGETLASLGGDGAVLLWNLPRGESWARFPCGSADRGDLLFSPDGNHLIVSAGYPRVLDVVGERWAGALAGTVHPYQSLAYAPDGRALAGGAQPGGADGSLELFQWLLAPGPLPRSYSSCSGYCYLWDTVPLAGGVRGLAWAPDGRTLAAAYDGRRVGLWDFDPAAPGRLAPPAEERRRPLAFCRELKARLAVERLAFFPGPDLRLAVAVGWSVELWDAAQGKRRQVLRGHKGAVRALAVSPDGRLLLTGGADGAVRLWDAATGMQRQAFDWGLGPIHALAFAPDGMTAAVGGDRPDVLVWDVDDA
jgi:WD40 repeat protein